MNVKSSLRGIAALAIAAVAGFAAPVTAQQGAKIKVDLELLLAVDISQSMDQDEHTIQRAEGAVTASTNVTPQRSSVARLRTGAQASNAIGRCAAFS